MWCEGETGQSSGCEGEGERRIGRGEVIEFEGVALWSEKHSSCVCVGLVTNGMI